MLQLKIVSPEKIEFTGEVDDLPEQAFLNVGTIDDAKEKAKKLLEAAKG